MKTIYELCNEARGLYGTRENEKAMPLYGNPASVSYQGIIEWPDGNERFQIVQSKSDDEAIKKLVSEFESYWKRTKATFPNHHKPISMGIYRAGSLIATYGFDSKTIKK